MDEDNKRAAKQFTARPSNITEIRDKIIPKPRASPAAILPDGIALPLVLPILQSISLSNHILIAPEAPAPSDIQKIDKTKRKG